MRLPQPTRTSQFIHHGEPTFEAEIGWVSCKKASRSWSTPSSLGYLVIRDPAEWQDVEGLRRRDPELRFLSFCRA